MELIVVMCVGLLMGCVGAEFTFTVTTTDKNQGAQYSKTLKCHHGTNVYVVSLAREYNFALCKCQNRWSQRCSDRFNASHIVPFTRDCWRTSSCTVSIWRKAQTCGDTRYPSAGASFTYACAPARPTLAIDSESSATGSSITAGYSAAGNTDSGPSASWVCSVEASDCSRVNVTLLLVIRNNKKKVSYFAVSGDTLGVKGVSWKQETYMTPFSVVLNVTAGSVLQNAYIALKAPANITTTCGRRFTIPPTALPNFSFASTSPVRKFGQALTAVHSSSGPETAGNWTCVVEAADCSTTSVNVSVYIRNRPCGPAAYFSVEGSRLESGGSVTRSTPLAVSLHLVQGSQVDESFVHVAENITMTCRRQTTTPPKHFCTSPAEQQRQSQTSVVGPAVGGTLAALVVIAVVVIIAIVFVWRKRIQETKETSLASEKSDLQQADLNNRTQKMKEVSLVPKKSEQQQQLNNGYEDIDEPEDNSVAASRANPRNDLRDQHYVKVEAASAVTSENDVPYDVLGQKQPAANVKHDVIYSHLKDKDTPDEDIEYSYDHAGKGPRRDVITSSVYNSAASVSPEGEASPEDVEYSYERAEEARSAEVPTTDSVYHVVEPESPAAEAEQDNGSYLDMKVKAMAQ